MRMFLNYLLLLSLAIGCASSKLGMTNEVGALRSLLENGAYEFTADVANPMVTQSLNDIANAGLLPLGSNVGAIQLSGTDNYLRVVGDSIKANLPYYGERRFGGGYGSKSGIEFDGIPTVYQLRHIKNRNRFEIHIKIAEKLEVYQVILTVFPNKSASMNVSSNQRNFISYTGTLSAIEAEAN